MVEDSGDKMLDQPVTAMYDTSQVLTLNCLAIAHHSNCYGGCDGSDDELAEGAMVMFVDMEDGIWSEDPLYWETEEYKAWKATE